MEKGGQSIHYAILRDQPEFWVGFLGYLNENVETLEWGDEARARELLRQGLIVVNQDPSVANVRPIVQELQSLLPNAERIRAQAGGTVSR